MKKFQQHSFGWCSVYSIANMLQDESLLKFLNDDRFKACNDKEEIEIVQQWDKRVSISNVLEVRESYKMSLPWDYVLKILNHWDGFDQLNPQFDIAPYLMTVRITEKAYHCVCVLNWNKNLFLLEPYEPKPIRISSSDDLSSRYIDVWNIRRPYLTDTNEFIVLSSNVLGIESDQNTQILNT